MYYYVLFAKLHALYEVGARDLFQDTIPSCRIVDVWDYKCEFYGCSKSILKIKKHARLNFFESDWVLYVFTCEIMR